MIKETKYCSHCGREISPILVGAETEYFYYGDSKSLPVGTKFNKETGQRQYVKKYICPNSSKYFNKHDDYIIEKIISK